MVSLITRRQVSLIRSRKMPVPTAKTLVFSWCSPYDHPIFEDDWTPIVFPAEKVVFWHNEKYFQDKWVFAKNFPNAKEMWISCVPGGFFDFNRSGIQKFVIPERLVYRGWPKNNTTVLKDNEWHDKVRGLLPPDIQNWMGGMNPKYEETILLTIGGESAAVPPCVCPGLLMRIKNMITDYFKNCKD